MGMAIIFMKVWFIESFVSPEKKKTWSCWYFCWSINSTFI